MKRIRSMASILFLCTSCQFFLPSGTPPNVKENITNTVKVLPSIMSLEQAQDEMRRRFFMGWAFKHNPAPTVRLVEDMTNSTYQKMARFLFYSMVADEELKIGLPTQAYTMHQSFAFGVNSYENNENVLVWETFIYPPQPTRDDPFLNAKKNSNGIEIKPLWRSLPIHIKWTEIESKFTTPTKTQTDTSYTIIRPVGHRP